MQNNILEFENCTRLQQEGRAGNSSTYATQCTTKATQTNYEGEKFLQNS